MHPHGSPEIWHPIDSWTNVKQGTIPIAVLLQIEMPDSKQSESVFRDLRWKRDLPCTAQRLKTKPEALSFGGCWERHSLHQPLPPFTPQLMSLFLGFGPRLRHSPPASVTPQALSSSLNIQQPLVAPAATLPLPLLPLLLLLLIQQAVLYLCSRPDERLRAAWAWGEWRCSWKRDVKVRHEVKEVGQAV